MGDDGGGGGVEMARQMAVEAGGSGGAIMARNVEGNALPEEVTSKDNAPYLSVLRYHDVIYKRVIKSRKILENKVSTYTGLADT